MCYVLSPFDRSYLLRNKDIRNPELPPRSGSFHGRYCFRNSWIVIHRSATIDLADLPRAQSKESYQQGVYLLQLVAAHAWGSQTHRLWVLKPYLVGYAVYQHIKLSSFLPKFEVCSLTTSRTSRHWLFRIFNDGECFAETISAWWWPEGFWSQRAQRAQDHYEYFLLNVVTLFHYNTPMYLWFHMARTWLIGTSFKDTLMRIDWVP